MNHAVLLAHSRDDESIAHVLQQRLETVGIQCWKPSPNCLPSESPDWDICRAIYRCRLLIYLCGAESKPSPETLKKLALAAELSRDILILRADQLPRHPLDAVFRQMPDWPDHPTATLHAWLNEAVKQVQARLTPPTHPSRVPPPPARVAVHFAYFVATGARACFINITNLSSIGDIQIIDVWLDFNPRIFASPHDRPLPRRLQPFETWETWIVKDRMGPLRREEVQCYTAARVRLSTGEIIPSVQNTAVPKRGPVLGGPILAYPRPRQAFP